MFSLLNKKGFSLVEVLMAAGIASGLALVVAKVSQNASQVTKTTETNNEINMFMSDAAYILSDKASCNSTIPLNSSANGYNPDAIRKVLPDGTVRDVYLKGPTRLYGNGTFYISDMQTQKTSADTVDLVVTIQKTSKVVAGGKQVKKRIPLKVVLDGTGNQITSCFSNTESLISEAVEAACQGNGATWDPVAGTCTHEFVEALCEPGMVVKHVKMEDGKMVAECAFVNDFTDFCPNGEVVVRIDSLGKRTCAPILETNTCAPGQYAWLNGGKVVCRNIPVCTNGLLRTEASGELKCVSFAGYCNSSNMYFTGGFDAAGNPICKQFPIKGCDPGYYVDYIDQEGNVTCKQVTSATNLPTVDYSFVDGYNSATQTWSRKSFDQVAQQVCARLSGWSWNGINCVPPVGASNYQEMCEKFPGFTWTGSQCKSPNSMSKMVLFKMKYNGSTWVMGLTKIIQGTYSSDLTGNVVIEAVEKPGAHHHKLRIHHNSYYMDSSEVLSVNMISGEASMKIATPNTDGNNKIELWKSDDASGNGFVNGDQVIILWGTPRL